MLGCCMEHGTSCSWYNSITVSLYNSLNKQVYVFHAVIRTFLIDGTYYPYFIVLLVLVNGTAESVMLSLDNDLHVYQIANETMHMYPLAFSMDIHRLFINS